MAKLSEKQQRFADEYLIDLNATQAALRAGYSSKSAKSQGQRLLTNADIKAYIDKRMETLKEKAIADQEEVLSYLTSLMRGEYKEQVLRGVGEGAQTIDDMDVSASQRIKAAELIGKRYGIWTDRHEVENRGAVTIVNNTSEMRRRMEDAAGDSD